MIYFFGFINFNFDVVFNNVYLCKLISFSFSGKHTIWLYLLWWHIDCLEIWHHQKLPWDCPEVAMRLPWCCPEVALRLLWGCTEDALRFARNCLKHVPWLNCAPMLPWGCPEAGLRLFYAVLVFQHPCYKNCEVSIRPGFNISREKGMKKVIKKNPLLRSWFKKQKNLSYFEEFFLHLTKYGEPPFSNSFEINSRSK